jgi:hypothetical protein
MLVAPKVKDVPQNAKQALRGGTGVAIPLLNLGAGRVCSVIATLRPLYPQKEKRYIFCSSRVGPRAGLDGSGRSPLTQGFKPLTVQPVATNTILRNITDNAIPAAGCLYITQINFGPQMEPCHGFDHRSVHVGFVVDKVALEQVFPRVLRFSPVNFIPPVLHYKEKRKKIIFITGLYNKL